MYRCDWKLFGYLAQAALLSSALVFAACGGDDDTPPSTDSDSDSDTDTEYDPTACLESGADSCICKVTGRLVDEAGEPVEGGVQLCPLAAEFPPTAFYNCNLVSAGADGVFEYLMLSSNECRGYAEEDEAIFDIRLDTGGFVKYSALYDPSPADIDGDFAYHVGDMVLYAEPAGGEPYNDSTGSVVPFDDGTLTLAADLADPDTDAQPDFPDGTLVNVMEFAVDGTQNLPFLPDDVTLDALYYVTPYFVKLFDPAIAVSLNASAVGWLPSDTGTLYQLGDIGGATLYCDSVPVEQGHFVPCGADDLEVDTDAGNTINFTINTPSWFGVAKN